MTVFAPLLGPLVAELARRQLADLWTDPAELARFTIDATRRTGATHALLPFDELVLAEAAGATIWWDHNVPRLRRRGSLVVSELEPTDVVAAGRTRAVVEVAGFVSREASVAALIPAPSLLLEQLATDASDEDLLVAEDVCRTLTRSLLEAGADFVLVTGGEGPSDAGIAGLRLLAEHFNVAVHTISGDPAVAPLNVETLQHLNPTRDAPDLGAEVRVITTDRSICAEMDIGRLARAARVLVHERT